MIVLKGMRRPITALAFGHDGRELIAGGGYDKAAEVWDTATGKSVRADIRLTESAPTPLAANPRFAWWYASTAFGTFHVRHPDGEWNLAESLGPKVYASAAAFAVRPDGGRVVVAYNNVCHVAAFEQTERRKPRLLWYRPVHTDDPIGLLILRGAAYFPAGDRFAVLEMIYRTGGTSRFTVRSESTGDVLAVVPVPASEPTQILAAPGGGSVVVRCGQVLNVWDAADFARPPVRVTNDNRKHFSSAAFHPSGRFLAATSRDETVKLYDARTWEVARVFTWDAGKLRSVCFSPDGTRAAVGSETGQIVMWDVDV